VEEGTVGTGQESQGMFFTGRLKKKEKGGGAGVGGETARNY